MTINDVTEDLTKTQQWLDEDARKHPDRMRRIARFNPNQPGTYAYWKAEIRYWRERLKEHTLTGDTERMFLDNKALGIAISAIDEVKRGTV